jgi:hypothetical protein
MKSRTTSIFTSILLILIILISPLGCPADELTFNSLYTKEIGIGSWVVAFASAIFAGALVYFSGGAAEPLIAQVATWIGSLAGLSGQAATNFGLALLGGGAAQGAQWGINATSAIMAALISFSGSMATEESLKRFNGGYDKSRLATAFAGLPVIPLPVDDSGSVAYETTIKYLHNNYKETSLRSDRANKEVISSAIDRLERMKVQSGSDSRAMVLLATLYQMRPEKGDCEKCFNLCQRTIDLERAKGTSVDKLTVPLALKAVCALGMPREIASTALGDFEKVVLAESGSVMVPVATAVFADRYSMREDIFSAKGVMKLLKAGSTLDEKRIRDLFTLCLLTRYNLKLNEYWSGLDLARRRLENEETKGPPPVNSVKQMFSRYMELTAHCGAMVEYLKGISPEDHYWLTWWNKKEISRLQEALTSLEASFEKHKKNRDKAREYRDQILAAQTKTHFQLYALALAGGIAFMVLIFIAFIRVKANKAS